MSGYSIGSLFSGYGGLDMGVQMALGQARTAWVSDVDAGPCQILAQHFPAASNLGDITEIDWSDVEPVDVITGGSPCQDLSMAGRREGMLPGTRSGLWESMFNAVRVLRPHLVVWENVRGAYSAQAFSMLESREGRVGDGPGGPVLRALGRVLGDLAGIGYDAQWVGVRAADIGAPHPRFRCFVVAYPEGDSWWVEQRERWEALGDTDGAAGDQWGFSAAGEAQGGRARPDTGRPVGAPVETLLPTPVAKPSGNTPEDHLRKKPGRSRVTDLRIVVESGLLASGGHLMPTPRASDGEKGGPNQRGSRGDYALPGAVVNLLPTPKAGDADFGLPRTSGRPPEKSTALATRIAYTDFGDYADAVRRWEMVMGTAPDPLESAPKGGRRLSPRFVEWMMGVPAGHVTDSGISRPAQLKALGNGVVPHQAAAAISMMAAQYRAISEETAA